MSEPLSPLAQAIVSLLCAHVGEELAISAPQMSDKLILWGVNAPERSIRREISNHYLAMSRACKGLICSKPGKGFFLTTDAQQIVARAARIEARFRAMKREKQNLHEALKVFGLDGLLVEEEEISREDAKARRDGRCRVCGGSSGSGCDWADAERTLCVDCDAKEAKV